MLLIGILRGLLIGAIYMASWSVRYPAIGVFTGLTAYVAFALIRPQSRCPCVRRRRRRRSVSCRKCQGTGVRFRRPVRLVHWAAGQAHRYMRERQEGER